MFSTLGGCQSALVFFHEWQAENKVRAVARRSLLRRTFLNGRVRFCERPNVPRIALLSNHTLNKGPCQQKFGGHLFSTQKNLCLLKYYFTSPQNFAEEQTCETKIKVDLSNIILTVMALWVSFSFFWWNRSDTANFRLPSQWIWPQLASLLKLSNTQREFWFPHCLYDHSHACSGELFL